MNWIAARPRRWLGALMLGAVFLAARASASTYVAYIPLDSSIYLELDTLDGLGCLDTYFPEIKPISRVEAARLTLEAEANLAVDERPSPLARAMLAALDGQLREEIGWVRNNHEDNLPTMVHPLERVEAQYIYSSGPRRRWQTGPNGPINAVEQTPLLPNNDGLPTASGSNENLRMYGWGGFGGFLTGYAEGAISGPFTRGISDTSRGQLLGAEAVLSLGNTAISFGQHEQSWGAGEFASLSQGDNAKPFPGLTVENVHPTYLPWILRYLGPGRRELVVGQLDADRAKSQHPWFVGHILVFKPLPTFEFGVTRTIIFGGRGNDHYNNFGFAGRFTGIATGNPANGNTKSRGGGFFRFRLPKLRNLELYQEIVGSDNLTFEIPTLGHYMPLLSVAYQGGFYLPRLTADGLTDLRFEYALIPGAYSVQNGNSLYFTYDKQLIGDPLGPNASQVDLQIGRWFGLRYKADVDFFYTEEAPNLSEGSTRFFFPANSSFYPYRLTKEHSFGVALGLFCLPVAASKLSPQLARLHGLIGEHARVAVEYADGLNYQPHAHSIRAVVMLSATIDNLLPGWIWR
ncbi:MAG: capsule assembly Wzi family protein [Candidatus Binataceae bacterium]